MFMKHAFFVLALIILCSKAYGQFNTYGELSLSGGLGKFLKDSEPGWHPGGTIHCMAGLQYGKVAFNAGVGFFILSDKGPGFPSEGKKVPSGDIDFPVGITIRYPLRGAILAGGADISGFIGGSGLLLLAPHIDLLFPARKGYRGIFIRAFTHIERAMPSFSPQYLGIGFKTTFG
jgi:hypothetical protein